MVSTTYLSMLFSRMQNYTYQEGTAKNAFRDPNTTDDFLQKISETRKQKWIKTTEETDF